MVDGTVRERFVVRMGRTVTVGRSPDDPNGIMIGGYLTGDAAAMISRNHVRLDLRDDGLLVTRRLDQRHASCAAAPRRTARPTWSSSARGRPTC